MKKPLLVLVVAVISGIFGGVISKSGAFNMTSKTAYAITEPMLIAGEQTHFSILPAGTVLYFDRAWPEGHQTYHAYFHFKGEFKAVPADAEMISPLWLRTVEPDELPKLLKDYPVTKEELVEILKARKITKAELVQMVREWPDEKAPTRE
jgi:hypothetical protein